MNSPGDLQRSATDRDRLSQSDDRRSVNSHRSKRSDGTVPDEELFRELGQINQKCDPMYFQSEVNKFGGGSLKETGETGDGGQSGQLRRSSSRSSSLGRRNSMSASRSQLKRFGLKKVVNLADKALLKRKLCRLATLLACLTFTVLFLLAFFLAGFKEMRLTVDWQDKDVVLKVNNCRVFVGPCFREACGGNQAYLSFLTSVKTIFTPAMYAQATFNSRVTATTLSLEVNHLDDTRSCNLYLSIGAATVMKSFTVASERGCAIIQENGAVAARSFAVTGDVVSLNMRRLATASLYVNASRGFVQFNDLDLASLGPATSRPNSITVGKGDIAVETLASVNVTFATASDQYCMAGASVRPIGAVSQSAIGPELATYRGYRDLEAGRFGWQWSGSVAVCSTSADCRLQPSLPAVSLANFEGNIYVNVLADAASTVDDSYQVFNSSRYGPMVGFPSDTVDIVENAKNLTVQSSLPNLIVRFVFGDADAWSARASKWTYVNHRIYAVIKPWWLSFFSLGRLVDNTNDVQTFLSPGFCPYRRKLSKADHLLIADAIGKRLDLNLGAACHQKSSLESTTPNMSVPSSGFQSFANFSQFSDEWVQVRMNNGFDDVYQVVYLTQETGPFMIMCLTLILAAVASLLLTYTIVGLLFVSFQKMKMHLYHQELYWSVFHKIASNQRKDALHFGVEDDDADKGQPATRAKEFHFRVTKSYQDLPSTMVYLHYIISQLWTSKSRSIARFYSVAFEKTPYDVVSEMDSRELQEERVSLKKFSSVYQQLCFILNMEEDNLTSSQNIRYLQEKGMMLTYGDSHKHFLVRLVMNVNVDLSLTFKPDKKATSLHVFLDKFCETTTFDEDVVPFDRFMDRYSLFCKLNHLEQVLLDLIILRDKFGIESRVQLRETIERDYDQIYTRDTFVTSNSLERWIVRLRHRCCKKSYYTLKLERAKNVTLFLAGKLKEADVGKREYKTIVDLAILGDGWWLHDMFMTVFELLLDCMLSIPLISIFIFQEIEHSSYSLRSESINIYGFNLASSDIWLVPEKVASKVTQVTKNLILLILGVLFIIFWVSAIFSMVGNIFRLEYPWIKSFDPYKSKGLSIERILSGYQWGFTFVCLACYLWYIGTVTIWNILASILNPKAYFASTGMALAFIYLVYILRIDFKRVFWDKNKDLKRIFKSMWVTRVITIMKKMDGYASKSLSAGGRHEYLMDGVTQAFSIQQSLSISEANILKISEENSRYHNFVSFFFSLIRKESSLRNDFERMMLDPPFGFNMYMTQLLANILFITKGRLELTRLVDGQTCH